MTHPQPPRKTVVVKAISPDRDKCEIVFPRVTNYRFGLPIDASKSESSSGSTLVSDTEYLSPDETTNGEIVARCLSLSNGGVVTEHPGERPITAIFDPYNRTGTTRSVDFVTTKETLWKTNPDSCHVNWAVCDSKREQRFCEIAERHPLTRAYVKNQGLGFEIPYRCGSEVGRYVPDFIVRIETIHQRYSVYLIVDVNGYRRKNAKDKKNAVEQYWVPSINQLGGYGKWNFIELGNIDTMEADYRSKPRECVAEYTVAPYTPAQVAAAKRLIALGGSNPGIEQVPRRKSRL